MITIVNVADNDISETVSKLFAEAELNPDVGVVVSFSDIFDISCVVSDWRSMRITMQHIEMLCSLADNENPMATLSLIRNLASVWTDD